MKQAYQFTLILLMAAVFAGCGDNSTQNPYMMGEKPADKKQVYTVSNQSKDSAVVIASIEGETQKEIAKINKERDVELQKLAQNTKLVEINAQNEIAVKEHNLSTFVQESDYAFKKSTLIVVSFALIAFLALALYMFRKRREDKLKMHENELQKEMYIREKELQVKMAEKILDTIASGKLSKEREQHLLETFDKAAPGLPNKK